MGSLPIINCNLSRHCKQPGNKHLQTPTQGPVSFFYLTLTWPIKDGYIPCCRCLTKDEQIIQGLSSGLDAPLEVKLGGVAGRGVFATAPIGRGSWLCEYKGLVYPLSEKQRHDEEYKANKEGSYIIQSRYPVAGEGRLCFDATRRHHQLGRYINHVQHPNAVLSKPFFCTWEMEGGVLLGKGH